MRPSWLLLVLFSLGVALPACRQAADQTAGDAEAIDRVREAVVTAENSGDLDGLVALHTDDAIRMPPNEPAVIGKEAIRTRWQAFFDRYTTNNVTVSSEEIIVAGDWAFDRGTYTIALPAVEGSKTIEESGKYLGIASRQPDGSWRWSRLIWNSNSRPATME